MQFAHVLTRLYNTPLLMAEDKLDIITNNVTLKLLAGERPVSLAEGSVDSSSENKTSTQGPVAVIRINGTLVSHNAAGESGVLSYERIANNIRYALSEGFKTLVFAIKSNGGEADGNFGLTKFIKSLPDKYGVRTIAIVDGPANSGGYTIASAAQEIWATKSSSLGSIGVIATLIDLSEADKKNGIAYKFVRSKDEKALLSGHEPITNKVENMVRDKVMVLDEEMNRVVNENRPVLSIETIKDLKGRSILGEEALKLGLIDKLVESFDVALDDLVSLSKNTSINNSSKSRGTVMNLEEENTKLKEEIATLKADAKVTAANAVKAERERVTKIIEAGQTFGVSASVISKRISAGTSFEDSVEMFEGIKEAVQEQNATPNNLGVTKTATNEIEGKSSNNPFDLFLKGQEYLENE
jgi:ClpP class serine protease